MIQAKRKTEYAIRILLVLMRQALQKRISGKQLQHQTQVPPAFMRRILAEMTQAGLLDSAPGRHGGVRLRPQAAKVTLRQVVEIIEGPIMLSPCEDVEKCPFGKKCPTNVVWQRAQDAMLKELDAVTLMHLAKESET